mmetsp:Transcript_11533/g.32398  ORF Transcript_11533/g.32398 Transcript_11533/m.32398 type:complete len:347 (-) Transcript_11533:182-1222(-)
MKFLVGMVVALMGISMVMGGAFGVDGDCALNLILTGQLRDYIFDQDTEGIVSLLADDFSWKSPSFTVDRWDPQIWEDIRSENSIRNGFNGWFLKNDFSDATTQTIQCVVTEPNWTVLLFRLDLTSVSTFVDNAPNLYLLRWRDGKIAEAMIVWNTFIEEQIGNDGTAPTPVTDFPSVDRVEFWQQSVSTAQDFADCVSHQDVTCITNQFALSFTSVDLSYTLPNGQTEVVDDLDAIRSGWSSFFADNSPEFPHIATEKMFVLQDGSVLLVTRQDLQSDCTYIRRRVNSRSFYLMQVNALGNVDYLVTMWNSYLEAEFEAAGNCNSSATLSVSLLTVGAAMLAYFFS